MKFLGIDAERIVTESEDIPLEERVRRVNEICGRFGAENVVLVSIHCNASKNGEWGKARGWSAYTSKGKTKSDELATMLYAEAEKNFAGLTIRKVYRTVTLTGKRLSISYAKQNAPPSLRKTFSWTMNRM